MNSKGQFIAVMSIVIIGILVYTGLSMGMTNFTNGVDEYYIAKNFADMYVEVIKIPEKTIAKLSNMYEIESVEGRVVSEVPLKVENKNEKVKVRVISINSNDGINQLFIEDGEFLSNEGKEVLVLKQFADARGIKVGDEITPQIGGKSYNLKVKGIVSSPEYVYLMENEQSLLPNAEKFGIIYLSEKFSQQVFGFKDSFNELLFKVKPSSNLSMLKSEFKKDLKKYGVRRIILKDEQLSNRVVTEEIKGAKQMSNTVPLIFLAVAAAVTAVMLSRMVKNDRTTIGILKAMGFSNSDIVIHYSKYSFVVGIIGGTIGTILGVILSRYMAMAYTKYYNLPMINIYYPLKYVFISIVITVCFCILSGLWGTRRIMKISPAESMRPEAPKTGRRIFLDRINFIWNNVSFSWKIVLKNVFRSKKRFLFITFGIALTFAIITVPTHLGTMFVGMFNSHYGEFLRMDYDINFSKPMNEQVALDVANIINENKIEPKIEYPFELSHGWKSKIVNIIGVRSDSKFIKFINSNGKQINLPKNGIVLSENLSKIIGASKGDIIKVGNFIPNKDDINIKVSEVIKQGLGINAYMNIDQMRNILLDEELATGLYIDTDDIINGKLENMKNIASIKSIQEMRNTFEQFLGLTIFSIGLMIVFSGLLGFVIVYNSTIMSINERKLEMSSLRVMGFKKKEIYGMLQKENIIMTIFGICIGIPLGKYMITSISNFFSNEMYTLSPKVKFITFIYSGLLTILFVVIAQLFTKRKVNRLNFIEALKNRIS